MVGEKSLKWGLITASLLLSVGVLCEDLEEKTASSYVSVSQGGLVLLSGEGEREESEDTETALTKEEEDAKRRRNNQYFAAFVTLGAIGNSVSFYKLAKKMK